jgi:hypothetical protein
MDKQNLFPDESPEELVVARWLVARQEALDPRPGFLVASQKRVMEAIRVEQARRPALRSLIGFFNNRAVQQFVLAVLLLAVFLTGHTAVMAADTSIPGDPVYPIKLALEKVELLASLSSNQDARLQILFSQRRLSELQATILEGRYEYIPGVAHAFQSQIGQTLQSLGQMSSAEQENVYNLINNFNNSLNIQTLTLTALATMIPPQERDGVAEAIDASSQGTQKMQDLMGE